MSKSTTKKPAKTAKAVRATTKSKKTNPNKFTVSTLRLLNFTVAALLAGQAVALVLLSNKDKGGVSITANYLTRDPVVSQAAGQTVLVPAADQLLSINLAYIAAGFLALGAITSLLLATRFRRRYEADLKSGTNSTRWVTYILTLNALLLTTALLAGITDLTSLLMLFIFTTIASMLAINTERQRKTGSKSWLSRLAVITGIAPVAAIALYVFMAHIYGGGLPVRTLIAIGVSGLGLLITSLALNNAYKTNTKPAQYPVVERTHLIFAFLVPTAFAWVIFSLLLK